MPTVANLGPTSFTNPGPFAAGEATLSLAAGGPLVEVWYPAPPTSIKGLSQATYNVASWLPPALQKLIPPGFTGATYRTGAYRGVPIASGRFPLVVFTHGYSGFRDQSAFLTSRLATWGFVVAAPDLPDNDLTAVLSGVKSQGLGADIAEQQRVISLMASDDSNPSDQFYGHLDMSRVAAIGHSLGGAISEGLAVSDPRVSTFIGMAGATVGSFGQTSTGATSQVPAKPGMLMVGTADQVVSPAGIASSFVAMHAPKRLVTLRNFGHLVFADICEIGTGRGGLVAIANSVHITIPPNLKKLATDGCNPPDTPVTEGWPVVRQAVTAQLRHVFGFDPSLAGLSGLGAAFPHVVARNVYVGPAK
ncbi:MAG: alpha/beta hydrolase family protein [Acidimicrobiales bacterium]